MPGGSAKRVGVFTRASLADIEAATRLASLDYVQLHGGQSATFCRAAGPERVIKVFWPERHSRASLEAKLAAFAPHCAYFLFDAGKGGGGSGKTFAWEMLRDMAIPRPWFLAGGIGPDNADTAVAACSPWGLDINSGVEMSPGVKDAEKIRSITHKSIVQNR